MTTRPDAIDRLSPAVRYQIANGLGWSGLRPVQALSTEAILDGAALKSVEEILGVFPVVALTLADRELIYGAPAIRRQEIDRLLCQLFPSYYPTLRQYAEALKSRNHLLGQPTDHKAERLAFEAQMSEHGAVMVRYRTRMVERLQEQLVKTFSLFAPGSEAPQIAYTPHTAAEDLPAAWQKNLPAERARGVTLAGPHRDHIEIHLNGQLAENFASEGQKFSIVLALKLAGLQLLEEKLKIAPVLIADDLLLELDAGRQEKFWTVVEKWQVFASGTSAPRPHAGTPWQVWHVKNGAFHTDNA